MVTMIFAVPKFYRSTLSCIIMEPIDSQQKKKKKKKKKNKKEKCSQPSEKKKLLIIEMNVVALRVRSYTL